MKTVSVLVLLAMLAIGKDSAGALRSSRSLQKPGACPIIPPTSIGACDDTCLTDESCPEQLKCCNNGCGQDCMPAVFGKSGSPLGDGLHTHQND